MYDYLPINDDFFSPLQKNTAQLLLTQVEELSVEGDIIRCSWMKYLRVILMAFVVKLKQSIKSINIAVI